MTKIKICGLSRPCDIEAVNEAGPDYIGFVFAASRRQVTEETARELARLVRPEIQKVGVFVDAPPEQILRLCGMGVIDLVQLHGNERAADIETLKRRTDAPVIKALRLEQGGFCREALREAEAADLLLFDSGKGTGKTFDWACLPETKQPFFLAGGLNEENILSAVEQVRPYGVDLSSGVETGGWKDREKIQNIVRRIRYAQG